MITLSYSTINMLYQSSHNWLNKQMGLKVPDNEFFRNGHRIHKIIQDYLSGKTDDPRLAHITLRFPVVEEKEFDERCGFQFKVNDKYNMRGFIDAQDPEKKMLCEIKTGSTMWTIGKFVDSMQRKVYALGKSDYEKSFLITALNDTEWEITPPKVFTVPLTPKDKEDALEWIKGGIELIEKGDFTGGLTEGKCLDRYCYYGANCQFK